MKTRTHLRAIAHHLSIYLSIYLSIICLFLPQNVWGQPHNPQRDVNIYASLLSYTLTNKDATFKFATNSANGKGVWVYIDTNGDGVCDSIVSSNPDKLVGKDWAYVTSTNLPGGRYKYAIKVKGNTTQTLKFNTSGSYFVSNNTTDHKIGNNYTRPASAINWYATDKRYDFQYPKGLVVNTYHDSEHLGFSYVGEAGASNTNNQVSIKTQNNPEENSSFHRRNTSQGIYIFRPNLGQVLSGANNGAFTGGITWCTARTDENKYFGPNRLSTDKDGYVYVCENRPTEESANRIWRVHHDQMTTTNSPNFTCIMRTSDLSSKSLEQRVLAMSVGYINDEKMLYVITGYTKDAKIRVDDGYCHLSCWKIIETGNGNCELKYQSQMSLTSIKQGSTTHKLISPVCSVVPGNENGDLWIFQRTDDYNGLLAKNNQQFSALHLSKLGNTWVADYHIPSKAKDADDEYHQNCSGIGAISTHHVIGNTNEYYLAMPCRAGANSANSEGFVIKIFRMYKNSTGLHRARWWNLYRDYTASPYAGWGRPGKAVPAAEGEGIDGIAFDAANNLFFTASGRHMYVYSLPKENEHLTYGPHMLHVPYGTTKWVPNKEGYSVVSGSGEMKELMLDTDPMPVLSKDGFYFNGWYDNRECTGDAVEKVQQDNITFYGKWTELRVSESSQADQNEYILGLVNNEEVHIKVDRKLQGGMYSTLCLPFSVNTTILEGATNSAETNNPLSGAKVLTFSGVETQPNGTKKTLLFSTPQNGTIPANTPFLIMPKEDVTEEIYFHDVTISKPSDLNHAGMVKQGNITFHGVINPTTIEKGKNTFFLVADNRLAISNSATTMYGLRGYFTADSASQLQIRIQEGAPTLLENVNTHAKDTYKILQDGKIYIVRDLIIYDLQGHRVTDL